MKSATQSATQSATRPGLRIWGADNPQPATRRVADVADFSDIKKISVSAASHAWVADVADFSDIEKMTLGLRVADFPRLSPYARAHESSYGAPATRRLR